MLIEQIIYLKAKHHYAPHEFTKTTERITMV